MADSPVIRTSSHQHCEVRDHILLGNLEKLLLAVVQGLKFRDLPNITPEAKIEAEWLSTEFTQTNVPKLPYYVNPALIEWKPGSDSSHLSLEDLTNLFHSIELELVRNHAKEMKLAEEEHLLTEDLEKNVLQRISKQELPKIPEEIKKIALGLLEVVHIIREVAEGEEEKEEQEKLSAILPTWLQSVQTSSQALIHLEIVKEALEHFEESFTNHKGTPETEFPGVELRPTDPPLSPAPLRLFFNSWVDHLFAEDRSPEKRIKYKITDRHAPFNVVANNPDWFPPTNNLIDQAGIEYLHAVIKTVEEYLKQVAETPEYAQTSATASEQGEADGEERKSEEELTNLLERFQNAGQSYQEQAARMRGVLFQQFFVLHGIDFDPAEFQRIDPTNFSLLEREFGRELELALRSLTDAEISQLDTINGRMNVVRKLYGRLSSNPRFLGNLGSFVQNYTTQKALDINDVYDRADNIERLLEKGVADESDAARALTEARSLQKFGELHNVNINDFKQLFERFGIVGESDQDALFKALDLTIAERWSPEQIRYLTSPAQFKEVFKFEFPNEFLTAGSLDLEKLQLFLNLCSEYVYLRRYRLADHYKIDAINRDKHREDDWEYKSVSEEDLKSYSELRSKTEKYSGETIIAALASDQDRIREYLEGGREDAGDIEEIYDYLAKRRLAELEAAALTAEQEERSRREYDEIRNIVAVASAYEVEDGVADQNGKPLRHGDGRQAMSPFQRVREVNKKIQKAQKTMKRVRQAAALAGAGLDVIGSTVPGAGFLPKPIRQTVGALVIGSVGAFLTSTGAQIGAVIGSTVGAVVGFFIPGLGVIGGATAGGLIGGWTGFIAEKNLGGAAGFSSPGTISTLGPSASPVATAPAATQAATAAGATKAAPFWSSPALQGTVGLGLTGATMAASLTTAAFLPPLPTIGADGTESKYVSIEKSASPMESGKLPEPRDLTYSISIEPKNGYKIVITSITDEYTVLGNEKERGTKDVPQVPSPPITLDTIKAIRPDLTLNQEGDIIDLPPYTGKFGSEFQHTNVTNTVTLKFKVYDEKGELIKENGQEEQTATTAEVACFGECPQSQNGCWPTSGYLFQDPYCESTTDFTHCKYKEDAFDITGGHGHPITGAPVYATFEGSICAEDWGSQGYGKHVKMLVDNGGFTLTYAHFSKFGPGISTSSCKGIGSGERITPGTIIGYVGDSGNSSGPHLHYQYGRDGDSGPSKLRSLVPDGSNVSATKGSFVRSCYETSSVPVDR